MQWTMVSFPSMLLINWIQIDVEAPYCYCIMLAAAVVVVILSPCLCVF